MTTFEWYERQRNRDVASRAASEALLGSEREMFAQYIGLTASCLDAVCASGPVDDLVVRRNIEFSNHAFSLLWSAWDEALCGRYDASRAHTRGVSECCEFLMALIAKPELADRLGSRTKDIHLARRAIRDGLNTNYPPRGTELFHSLEDAARSVQALSHVCHEAAGGALPIFERGGRNVAAVRPGGIVSEITLRLTAIPLATDAAYLFGVTSAAFIDVVGLPDEAWRDAIRRAQQLASELQAELEAVGATAMSRGPIGEIYLARTDEVVIP